MNRLAPGRALLAVFLRELAAWKWVLAAAPLLGIAAWLAPFLPTLQVHRADEVRSAALLLCTGLFLGGFAWVLGSTLLVRDLAEGRLGFYLSRPIPTTSLWLGKILAATVSLAMAAIGLMLPTWIGGSGIDFPFLPEASQGALSVMAVKEAFVHLQASDALPRALSPSASLVFALLLVVLGVLAVHTLTTILNTRGAWLLVDVLGAAVFAVALWLLRAELLAQQAYGALIWLERSLVISLSALLLLAGGLQLHLGRSDLPRGRRILSALVWGGCALIAAGAWAYGDFVLTPQIEDATELRQGRLSPDGRHLAFVGGTENRGGYVGLFLADLDASAGGPLHGWHLGGMPAVSASLRFSADGRVAVWPRCRSLIPTDCELYSLELDPGIDGSSPGSPRNATSSALETSARATGILLQDFFGLIAVAPDGSTVAVGTSRQLAVYDLQDGRLETAIRVGQVRELKYLDPDRIRFYYLENDDTFESVLAELDIAEGRNRIRGSLPGPAWGPMLESPDASQLLYVTVTPPRLQIRSSSTGEVLIDLIEELGLRIGDHLSGAHFLGDGRLVMVIGSSPASTSKSHTLVILDPANPEALRRLDLDGFAEVDPRLEVSPGRLLLAASFDEGPDGETARAAANRIGAPWAGDLGPDPLPGRLTLVLDVETGSVEPWASGLVPSPFLSGTDFAARTSHNLFLAGGRSLLRLTTDGEAPRAPAHVELLVPPFRSFGSNEPTLLGGGS